MSRHHHRRRLALPVFFLLLLEVFLPSAAKNHHQSTDPPIDPIPITRFREYLRIITAHPTPDYTSAINYLLNLSSEIPSLQSEVLYFTPQKDKPLLLLTWAGSDPTLPSILLNSHLDSVPAEPHKWVHPPFSAHYAGDGKIFARGAQDDKCIGIQYLEAIKSLSQENQFRPLRNLHISFVPDEETGGFDGMAKFVESEEFKKLNVGFVLDEGQASPGDEYRVFYADRSPWHIVIKAVGIPGHGSRMYDNCAMENLMKSIEVINKFRDAEFDKVKAGLAMNSEVISANPVFLNAGTPSPTGFVMNMQPSEAEAGFDVRLPPTADPDSLRRRIAEEWAPAWRNMTFKITEKGPLRDYLGRPLLTHTNDSNPWWSVFKDAVIAASGKLAKPEILASTTDARFMRQLGIPTLGFSPMKNTPILLHDHNEFLKDSVFLEGIKVYKSIIRSLTSFAGSP
ncbi:OLC1v1015371C1 [Oldenlandia corymbosa var. corymbosa]|uniref:N-acyl-aliphatic-L-amino acid amidohydrolase n=1 Tax=Oldenlandia corymbosa var. corymbosa TaxID=529605 RepID=A0AAV1E6G8_OLDCO|nr:OLC1v1015371C1 [Oldenlandia corymbosa var. corymbosa]